MNGNLNKPVIAKELSWLAFNERVLREATDKSVPIIERVRFLGIFSSNMDEYFRVRVADVRRLAAFSSAEHKEYYNRLLIDIRKCVAELQNTFEKANAEVMKLLRSSGIYFVHENQLQGNQQLFVSDYFYQTVLPELMPIMLTENSPIPDFDDTSIYLAAKLRVAESFQYAILNIPTGSLPRFVVIPSAVDSHRKVVIVLENIIRFRLAEVFRGTLDITHAQAWVFKVTRDAELELGEGISQSLVDKVSVSLKRRKKADPVRLVYDSKMAEDLLSLLVRRLKLGNYDSLIAGGRYHNSKDLMDFPNLGPKHLEYPPLQQIPAAELSKNENIFTTLREKDILLCFPYQPFKHVEDFLYSAALDPAVRSIKICLYRVAKNSRVVKALITAARNQKEVIVIVELQARFDEAANIDWANTLTENRVRVVFGVPGLKVHSKLILITRQEGHLQKHYAHIGTGNFNEKTAKLYTDISLLTHHQEITEDVKKVFDFIMYSYKRFTFNHLLVSPYSNRSGITELINTEIANARAGKPASIAIKCNNLVDEEIILSLYEASRAGVRIRLIVRGMCSLVPGVPGLSENIEGISIVDRFLEHSRIYIFHNDGNPKYYISSADLMTRNLDFRVEVTCPVYTGKAKQRLQAIFDIQWADTIKARLLSAQPGHHYRPRGNKKKLRSQLAIDSMIRENP